MRRNVQRNTSVSNDKNLTNLSVAVNNRLPFVDTSTTTPKPKGCIVYDPNLDNILVSTGTMWVSAGGVAVLPPPLQSIASLITSGDEMLYTTGANTYALSSITSAGRNFLGQSTVANQQSALLLTPGVNIQTQNALLQSISNQSGVVSANQLFYTTGATTVSPSSITAFGRNILSQPDALSVNNLLGSLLGTVSNNSRLVRVTGIDTVSETTLASIDGADNISGINNLTMGGLLTTPNANITTFTNPFSMNSNKITNLGAPTVSADAATKQYVDNAVAGAGSTFGPVQLATTGILTVISETGSGVGKTLTGTFANMGTIDGIVIALNDRILVKDNTSMVGASSNGIYVVTDDSITPGPNVVYTRATDADQSAEMVNGKTVVVLGGTTLTGTQWITASAISPPTVDTDPISFVQVSAFTGGTGIDITGNIISVDATVARDNNALALTNKTMTSNTNDITARALFSNNGTNTVSVYASPNPIAGQALIATNSTTATWQNISSTERIVTVAQSGGDYTTILSAITAINGGAILGGVPTATNEVTVLVSPGTYNESNPILVPSYVTIRGQGRLNAVVVTPTNVNDNIFLMSPFSACYFMTAKGATGFGFAGFFYNNASSNPARVEQCLVDNCNIGFHSNGTGAQYESILVLRNTAVTNTANPTAQYGYLVDNAGTIDSIVSVASGFSLGFVPLEAGYQCEGALSLMILAEASANFIKRGFRCENGGTPSTNQAELRVYAGTLAFIFDPFGMPPTAIGVELGLRAKMRLFSVYIQDDTVSAPYQLHIKTSSIGSPDQSRIQGSGLVLRIDKTDIAQDTIVEGYSLSTTPGESQNQFLGELAVGFPGRGYESSFGEGDSHTFTLRAYTYNASTLGYTEVTDDLKLAGSGSPVAIFPSTPPTVGDIFYIGSVGASASSSPSFPGIKLMLSSSAVSTTGGAVGGRTNLIEPPQYSWVWEYWTGAIWAPFRIMVTGGDAPYLPHRQDAFNIFSGLTSYQVRFDRIRNAEYALPSGATLISYQQANGGTTFVAPSTNRNWVPSPPNAPWTQNDPVVPSIGVNGYWIRIRLTTPLLTSPTLDQVKLHTNRTEINKEGFMEYFGEARPLKRTDNNIQNWQPSSVNPPTSTVIRPSATLSANLTNNTFPPGSTSTTICQFSLPSDVDTSHPFILQWRFQASSGASANVRWKTTYAYLPANGDVGVADTSPDAYANTGAPPTAHSTEESLIFTYPTPGTQRRTTRCSCRLNISDCLAERTEEGDGDIFWVSLSREGGLIGDTYAGTIYLSDISLLYLAGTTGLHD